MNVIYTDKSLQGGEGSPLIARATKILEEILGPSAGRVAVAWDRGKDGQGRLAYVLRISDSTESAEARFTADQLQMQDYVRVQLARLWGDILETRSDRLLRELLKSDSSAEH